MAYERPDFVTECESCGWNGGIDDVDSTYVNGVEEMPAGREDTATACPDCGNIMAAYRMRPTKGDNYAHQWERV